MHVALARVSGAMRARAVAEWIVANGRREVVRNGNAMTRLRIGWV